MRASAVGIFSCQFHRLAFAGWLLAGAASFSASAEDPAPPVTTDNPALELPAAVKPPDVAERIEKLTSGMRQAQTQLVEQNTGAATQDLQTAILAELDELLKTPPSPAPQNPQGGSGGGGASSSSSSQSQSQSQSQSSRNSQGASQQPQGGQPKPADGAASGSSKDREDAEDSEERTGERQRIAVTNLPRRRMEVDVWGHLPDKVREKLLSAYGERMVPQYEDLVQKFYRSLAETASPEKPPR